MKTVTLSKVHAGRNLASSDALQAEILFMLGVLGASSVAEIAEAVGESSAKVSYHLKKLAVRGGVRLEKVRGKIVVSPVGVSARKAA